MQYLVETPKPKLTRPVQNGVLVSALAGAVEQCNADKEALRDWVHAVWP